MTLRVVPSASRASPAVKGCGRSASSLTAAVIGLGQQHDVGGQPDQASAADRRGDLGRAQAEGGEVGDAPATPAGPTVFQLAQRVAHRGSERVRGGLGDDHAVADEQAGPEQGRHEARVGQLERLAGLLDASAAAPTGRRPAGRPARASLARRASASSGSTSQSPTSGATGGVDADRAQRALAARLPRRRSSADAVGLVRVPGSAPRPDAVPAPRRSQRRPGRRRARPRRRRRRGRGAARAGRRRAAAAPSPRVSRAVSGPSGRTRPSTVAAPTWTSSSAWQVGRHAQPRAHVDHGRRSGSFPASSARRRGARSPRCAPRRLTATRATPVASVDPLVHRLQFAYHEPVCRCGPARACRPTRMRARGEGAGDHQAGAADGESRGRPTAAPARRGRWPAGRPPDRRAPPAARSSPRRCGRSPPSHAMSPRLVRRDLGRAPPRRPARAPSGRSW